MNDKIVVLISGSAIFDLSLLAILCWIKSKNRPSNFWLGCMFFATAAAILDNLFIFIGRGSIILYHLGLALNVVWGGYLISFTNSLRNSYRKTIKFDWRLFIPAYLYFPFLILTIIEPLWGTKTIQMAEAGQMTVFGVFYNAIICLYTILSNVFLLSQEYSKNIRFNTTKLQKTRIKEILWVMLVLQLIAFVPFMFKFDITYIILYMPVFGQIFFLYVFFRMTFSIQSLFESDSTLENAAKYATIKIDGDKSEEIRDRIVKYIDCEKHYLKTDFTLTEMAKSLNVSANIVSMVINSKLNCSFPDYVNSLRVKTAIELLENVDKKNLTIEAISYECGFNNRTSFYKAFKKQTGKLPSDYIRNLENKKKVAI